MNFLVPCPACEKKLSVSSAQAGQPIRCDCGNEFEAPTMREMRALEPVAPSTSAGSTWNRRKGLAFLGCVILLITVIGGGFMFLSLPSGVTTAAVRDEIEKLPPFATYMRYQALRTSTLVDSPSGKVVMGPVQPLIQGTFENYNQKYLAAQTMSDARRTEALRRQRIYWLPLVIAVGAVGLGLTLSAIFVGSGTGRKPAPRRRPVGAS